MKKITETDLKTKIETYIDIGSESNETISKDFENYFVIIDFSREERSFVVQGLNQRVLKLKIREEDYLNMFNENQDILHCIVEFNKETNRFLFFFFVEYLELILL